jgi:hypothetical protein
MVSGFGNVPETANAGTDFAWSSQGAVFRPDRGSYHQSNLAHIRYDDDRNQSVNGIYGGFGPSPTITATQSDLIWAEALLRRTPTDPTMAATLIDKSRVTRGSLPSALAAVANVGSPDDGPCTSTGVLAKTGAAPCSLWSMLLYEKEIELLGLGPAPFFEARRLPVVTSTVNPRVVAGLLPGTPREMPVPAKELGVKGEALYTWGGATPNSPAP